MLIFKASGPMPTGEVMQPTPIIAIDSRRVDALLAARAATDEALDELSAALDRANRCTSNLRRDYYLTSATMAAGALADAIDHEARLAGSGYGDAALYAGALERAAGCDAPNTNAALMNELVAALEKARG